MSKEDAIVFYELLLKQQQDRDKHYEIKKISSSISISSDWVCLAAYLLDDEGSEINTGPDLKNHEVKSIIDGAYEYQYHKESWEDKLDKDGRVDHIFIKRSKNLLNVTVRRVSGSKMKKDYIDQWRNEITKKGYTGQRFRKSIAQGWVDENSKVILEIVDGKEKK